MGEHALIHVSLLLTERRAWPAVSSPAHLDFPALTSCDLEPQAAANPPLAQKVISVRVLTTPTEIKLEQTP